MQFLAEAMDSAIHAGLGDKYYELQVEFHFIMYILTAARTRR